MDYTEINQKLESAFNRTIALKVVTLRNKK